ncbi:MAG: hypothetical protein F6K39_24320 [Okeania sp. SIO3B3]|nr:hypothetical protein [Okeania sp. SIO3B3]
MLTPDSILHFVVRNVGSKYILARASAVATSLLHKYISCVLMAEKFSCGHFLS